MNDVKNFTAELTLSLIEKDMSKYENTRSFNPANSTNIDPSDVINTIMRDFKPAWDELAV